MVDWPDDETTFAAADIVITDNVVVKNRNGANTIAAVLDTFSATALIYALRRRGYVVNAPTKVKVLR